MQHSARGGFAAAAVVPLVLNECTQPMHDPDVIASIDRNPHNRPDGPVPPATVWATWGRTETLAR